MCIIWGSFWPRTVAEEERFCRGGPRVCRASKAVRESCQSPDLCLHFSSERVYAREGFKNVSSVELSTCKAAQRLSSTSVSLFLRLGFQDSK